MQVASSSNIRSNGRRPSEPRGAGVFHRRPKSSLVHHRFRLIRRRRSPPPPPQRRFRQHHRRRGQRCTRPCQPLGPPCIRRRRRPTPPSPRLAAAAAARRRQRPEAALRSEHHIPSPPPPPSPPPARRAPPPPPAMPTGGGWAPRPRRCSSLIVRPCDPTRRTRRRLNDHHGRRRRRQAAHAHHRAYAKTKLHQQTIFVYIIITRLYCYIMRYRSTIKQEQECQDHQLYLIVTTSEDREAFPIPRGTNTTINFVAAAFVADLRDKSARQDHHCQQSVAPPRPTQTHLDPYPIINPITILNHS